MESFFFTIQMVIRCSYILSIGTLILDIEWENGLTCLHIHIIRVNERHEAIAVFVLVL